MPPCRSKLKKSNSPLKAAPHPAAARPNGKRVAESDASLVKPQAKKAKTEIRPVASSKTISLDIDDEEPYNVESDASGNDDGEEKLPPDIQERLDYIENHTEDLTNTFHRMIFKSFRHYMGPRSGNAAVAAAIVNHCAMLAHGGESDLRKEKRLVKSVYRMCYPGDSESEESGEDDEGDSHERPEV